MRVSTTLFLAVIFWMAPPSGAQTRWQTLGDASSIENRADGVEIQAQHGRVRITALSPTVVHVQYSLQNEFSKKPSFAVLPKAFERSALKLQVADSVSDLSLRTGLLTVRIYKSPLRIALSDAACILVSEERPSSPPMFDGTAFKVWKAMPEDEHYFGL